MSSNPEFLFRCISSAVVITACLQIRHRMSRWTESPGKDTVLTRLSTRDPSRCSQTAVEDSSLLQNHSSRMPCLPHRFYRRPGVCRLPLEFCFEGVDAAYSYSCRRAVWSRTCSHAETESTIQTEVRDWFKWVQQDGNCGMCCSLTSRTLHLFDNSLLAEKNVLSMICHSERRAPGTLHIL